QTLLSASGRPLSISDASRVASSWSCGSRPRLYVSMSGCMSRSSGRGVRGAGTASIAGGPYQDLLERVEEAGRVPRRQNLLWELAGRRPPVLEAPDDERLELVHGHDVHVVLGGRDRQSEPSVQRSGGEDDAEAHVFGQLDAREGVAVQDVPQLGRRAQEGRHLVAERFVEGRLYGPGESCRVALAR